MLIRSKAPLRIGLAGGGTDVSPYSEIFGGAILNCTITLYANATLSPRQDGLIVLDSKDLSRRLVFDSNETLPIDGDLDLLKGVYNRIVKDFLHRPLSFTLTTSVDVPKGSGLGSSSTLTVALIGVFVEWFKLPLGEYDIAQLAYQIEREDLKMAGGKQDQYAATFGGFNFMEFYTNNKVVVSPMRIKKEHIYELESNLLLFYTGASRVSSDIIERQMHNFNQNSDQSIEAAHMVKEQAIKMKHALLTGHLGDIGTLLNDGWLYKKKMARGITNGSIDNIYRIAIAAGATGGKISGAGGGGFITLYCPDNTQHTVRETLIKLGGTFQKFNLSDKGLVTWTI